MNSFLFWGIHKKLPPPPAPNNLIHLRLSDSKYSSNSLNGSLITPKSDFLINHDSLIN